MKKKSNYNPAGSNWKWRIEGRREKKNGRIKVTMLVPIEKEQEKDIIGKRERQNWKGKATINPNTKHNAIFIILYTKFFFLLTFSEVLWTRQCRDPTTTTTTTTTTTKYLFIYY